MSIDLNVNDGVLCGDRYVSHADLLGRAARAAQGLANLGVGPGVGVAIMLRNDIPFLEASIAIGMLGGQAVPVNWHWVGDEVGYLLTNSESRALVIHADLLPQVWGTVADGLQVLVVPTPPDIAEAYRLRPDQCEAPAGARTWDEFVAAHEPWSGEPAAAALSMVYTSGTTGRPKGVRRSQPTAEQSAGLRKMIVDAAGLSPDIRSLIPAPLYHAAPNAYGITAASMGAFLVLQQRFDAEEFLALVERHRLTHIQVVPLMFVRLLKLPQEVRDRYDHSSLQYLVHAAAPCPPEIKRQVIDWLGPIINEYYGCTESGAVVFCTSEEWLAHPGTVGKALEGAIVKVYGPDGSLLGPGEIGEVYVRHTLMADFTYKGMDDKRREIERDGCITCGDIGYLDEDGFLYLCDRATDLVISGGVNIYPAEIESVLLTLDGVLDCAVFGIPDDEYGEALAAVVEPMPGAALTADDVRTFLRGAVAGYKVPKVVEFSDELPREDSGKIFKRRLRDPYWESTGRSI